MKIYTKTGDNGETSLLGGKRVPKTDPLIWILGTIDELNASLGLVNSRKIIVEIQNDLMALAAIVAGNKDGFDAGNRTLWLEKNIDLIEAKLPPLKNFIIPGGSEEASSLHVSRAICRRLERYLAEEVKFKGELTYINRLSDLLFVLARYANLELGVADQIWNSNH